MLILKLLNININNDNEHDHDNQNFAKYVYNKTATCHYHF